MAEELIRFEPGRTLTPVMNLTLAKSRLAEFQTFIKEYMVEGEDYGLIPGTQKKTLYKPGADKLCELYGLTDSYRIIDRIVDFDRGLFDYEIECSLSRDGQLVATGLGSCSSFEGKYRWRDSRFKCPACGKETIIKGREEYGGGWLCFPKKGGCGAKFPSGDRQIEGQTMGQVENEDIATLKNTILKMAKKRAKVDAALAATRSSGIFTQDAEEEKKREPIQPPQRKSESKPEARNGDAITDSQKRRLWAIAYEKNPGKDKKAVADIVHDILARYGIEHTEEIKQSDYKTIIAEIEGADSDPM